VVLADRLVLVHEELEDRGTRAALEDGLSQGRGADGAVGVDDEEVHAAELVDGRVGFRVEEADLRETLLARLNLREPAGRVVAASLGRAHAAGAGTVVVAVDPDIDRVEAALEVRAHRRGDQ